MARFSGAKIKIADKYCANIIIGMLYPLMTENKLITFFKKSLRFLLNAICFKIIKLKITKNFKL